MSDTFDYAPAGALRAAEADLKKWRDNVEFMLDDGDPDVIRAHEGGGPEDLIMSLVLTLNRTRAQRDIAMGIAKPTFAERQPLPEVETPHPDEIIPWNGGPPSPELQADYAAYREIKRQQFTRLLTPLIAETALHGQWHNASVRETLRAGVYAYNRLGNRKVTDAFGDDMVDAIVKRLIEAGWKPSR